jgi:hypothetical protein
MQDKCETVARRLHHARFRAFFLYFPAIIAENHADGLEMESLPGEVTRGVVTQE